MIIDTYRCINFKYVELYIHTYILFQASSFLCGCYTFGQQLYAKSAYLFVYVYVYVYMYVCMYACMHRGAKHVYT